MKKKLIHHFGDTLQKLGIAGGAIALFRGETDHVAWSVLFIAISFISVILENRL